MADPDPVCNCPASDWYVKLGRSEGATLAPTVDQSIKWGSGAKPGAKNDKPLELEPIFRPLAPRIVALDP